LAAEVGAPYSAKKPARANFLLRAQETGENAEADMADTDYMKVLSEAWASTGTAVSATQQQMFKDMAERMGKAFIFPFQAFIPGGTGGGPTEEPFRQLFLSALRIPEAIGSSTALGSSVDRATGDLLQKMLDPRAWLSATGSMDETVRLVVEGPKLADLGQIETKFLSLMKAWTEARSYSIEHSTHLLSAWAKAAGAFSAKLNEAAAGRPLSSRSEMVAMWVDIANQHLFEVQRSAPFLETQRKLLRASSALKIAQRELSELYSETFGLPTRGEVDDLTRTVAELKREFRADKRQRERASAKGRISRRTSA
jgi:hypothetical protein